MRVQGSPLLSYVPSIDETRGVEIIIDQLPNNDAGNPIWERCELHDEPNENMY